VWKVLFVTVTVNGSSLAPQACRSKERGNEHGQSQRPLLLPFMPQHYKADDTYPRSAGELGRTNDYLPARTVVRFDQPSGQSDYRQNEEVMGAGAAWIITIGCVMSTS
jgi:hypothetical protein